LLVEVNIIDVGKIIRRLHLGTSDNRVSSALEVNSRRFD